MAAERVMIIGLDCAAPELVFDRFAADMPNLSALRQRGRWGRLESIIPPITVPAWAAMMSGKDAGQLGVYGFRNRKSSAYEDLETARSDSIREPQLWDILGSIGLSSIVLGVPPGYPVPPLRGVRVGCFLTPGTDGNDWAYPASLCGELRERFGRYAVDVANFRNEDKERLRAEIFALNQMHFDAAEHLLATRPWQFFIFVNIAVDRMHHAFWSFFDSQHRKHVPGNPYQGAMREFYRQTDERIGRLLEKVDDRTAVLVVSDHGAKRIDGGICINEWLIREGLLKLSGPMPSVPTPYAKVGVDWAKTKVWGEGGYYARVFINREGREPEGTVSRSEYESLRDHLAEALRRIPDDRGNPLDTKVYKPDEIYPEARGLPPDLLVHFGDLHWRSIGTVGHGSVHTLDNDTGPDDANHAQHGMYILAGPGVIPANADGHLLQIAPTVLKLLGKRIPRDMRHPPMPVG